MLNQHLCVLGFPTSPSTSATSSSTFSAHAPPGGSNDSRLPRPGLAQGGEAALRGPHLASLPCSLARIPSSFLHRSAVLSCVGLPKFGCRRQSQHPAPAAPACRRGSVAACRQHGLDAYFDGKTQRRCWGVQGVQAGFTQLRRFGGGARISGERTGRDRSVCCNESVGAVVVDIQFTLSASMTMLIQ